MKKLLLMVAALLVGLQAHAQFSADGGYFHAFENSQNMAYTSPSQDGLFLGARYSFNLEDLMDGLSFVPGLNLSALKGKVNVLSLTGVYEVRSRTTTRELAVNMPLQLKFSYEFLSNFTVYGFAGPTLQLGVLNNVVDKNDNATTRYDMYKSNNFSDAARKPFNLYLGLGAGVEVAERIQVNVGFDFGLLNLTTGKNEKLHRHVLKIGVGYIF